jgi:hypothetical protein
MTRQLSPKADLYALANRIPVRFWNRTNGHLVCTQVTSDYRLSNPGTCYVTEWKTENEFALRSWPVLQAESPENRAVALQQMLSQHVLTH